MAKRPIFIPTSNRLPFVKELMVNFEWHSGLAKTQAQKSIASLHKSAAISKIDPILEISSKSANHLGVYLSAFNLMLQVNGERLSVECAYQGSKVFENGGPYTDLYYASSRDAKTDERLRNSGDFVGYEFFGETFPDKPVTAFYDWLYLTALSQNSNLAEQLFAFQGFSDIVFNPDKSLNCQARAAALFVSLQQNEELEHALKDKDYYIALITNQTSVLNTRQNHAHVQDNEQLKLVAQETTDLEMVASVEVAKIKETIDEIQVVEVDCLPQNNDIFENFFLLRIDSLLTIERTKEEVAQSFGIPEELAGKWLKKAEELGKVKRLGKARRLDHPVRYLSTSNLSQQQLLVNLEYVNRR